MTVGGLALHAALLDELRLAVGDAAVSTDPPVISRILRDNSWLSPVLTAQYEERRRLTGPSMGVIAAVSPASDDQVQEVLRLAVRYRVPVSARGSGTSNFGQAAPTEGGILLDLRQLTGEIRLDGRAVAAHAGELQGKLERAARASGRELTLLTTTYDFATVGGWVAGGHVGLGSGMHGAIWDGNVLAARLVTATDEPEVLVLSGPAVEPVLHTFGCTGIITEITLPTVDAHTWTEAVGLFPSFAQASEFVRAMSVDPRWRHRAVAAQEPEVWPAFSPLFAAVGPGAGVLMIVDAGQLHEVRALAVDWGGQVSEWQPWGETQRPAIGAMVYGHRMLWIKRHFPRAAFAHLYLDPVQTTAHVAALKDRFGSRVLLDSKYIRSAWLRRVCGHSPEGTLPAIVATICEANQPGAIEDLLAFCDDVGIRYQNPHTAVLEDTGLFPDISSIVRFKSAVDPYNLLNPDKLRSAEGRP
jgi:FAD/FMN-containing dehydrogenase